MAKDDDEMRLGTCEGALSRREGAGATPLADCPVLLSALLLVTLQVRLLQPLTHLPNPSRCLRMPRMLREDRSSPFCVRRSGSAVLPRAANRPCHPESRSCQLQPATRVVVQRLHCSRKLSCGLLPVPTQQHALAQSNADLGDNPVARVADLFNQPQCLAERSQPAIGVTGPAENLPKVFHWVHQGQTALACGCLHGFQRWLKRDLNLKVSGISVRRSQAREEVSKPKNKPPMFQVIPKAFAKELQESMLRIEGQRLFPGKKGGPLANDSLNRWYRQLAREAGVRPISSHGARHTSGSSYAVMAVGQRVIATLLGHADVGTTQRYTHVDTVSATQPLVEERWRRLNIDGRDS